MKKIIGITGSIGSGKTYVSKLIERKGFPVFYFDDEAKKKYFEPEIKEQIISLLGKESYQNGVPDFGFIARKIFQEDFLLRKVQEIIYPSLRKTFFVWVEEQASDKVFCEAAILVESGFYRYTDSVVAVYSPLLVRLKRLMQRENTRNFSTFARRIDKQMPPSHLFRYARYILFNDGICSVQEQIDYLLENL